MSHHHPQQYHQFSQSPSHTHRTSWSGPSTSAHYYGSGTPVVPIAQLPNVVAHQAYQPHPHQAPPNGNRTDAMQCASIVLDSTSTQLPAPRLPVVPAPSQYQHPTAINTSWRPGHSNSLSQSAIAPHSSSPAALYSRTSPADSPIVPPGSPGRPVSPRPQFQDAVARERATSPVLFAAAQSSLSVAVTDPLPRVHSPQPRRNTMPSPTMLQGQFDAPAALTRPSRRPLPSIPAGSVSAGPSSHPPSRGNSLSSQSPNMSAPPSSILSRSSSSASTSSISTTGSIIRRPLPRPPSASTAAGRAHGTIKEVNSPDTVKSSRPATYASAQAEISRENSRSPVVQVSEQATMPVIATDDANATPKKANSNVSRPPIPSFTFDDTPSSSAPSISISAAPPSPRLSKATIQEYISPSDLEDEGIPLPVSSVPMATSTKVHPHACPECERPVLYGRVVNALGRRYHPDCFQCVQCHTKLEHMEFFTKDAKPYCHVDYHELFSIRCTHCKTPIVDETYITIEDTALGGKRQYHETHFFCANCGDPFVDPKARSSEVTSQDEYRESLAKPFTVHRGFAYCEGCNTKLHLTKCSKCKKPIVGDVLKAYNRNWCENCFVCDSCSKPFLDGSFLTWQSKPHCEDCYCAKAVATT